MGDGPERVPLALLALLLESGAVPADVVDDAEAAMGGDEVASLEGADPRFRDEAHGGEGDGSRGAHGAGLNEALEVGLGDTGLGRQMDMNMGDKGGGDEGDEERRHDAAEDDLRGVAERLVGVDVGRGDDADEEGA